MSNKVDLAKILIPPDRSIREVMRMLDASGLGIALVVDGERHLQATITDGDIRRAILTSVDLDGPVTALARRAGWPAPLTALAGTSASEMIRLMRQAGVRHLPLLDADGRVVDVVRLGDVEPSGELPLTAVVMAGGFGMRLRPLTNDLPKPLLPVGDTPLLEVIVRQQYLSDVQIRSGKQLFVHRHQT